jgi:glutamate-ammonia-ligase adenylyltransferase
VSRPEPVRTALLRGGFQDADRAASHLATLGVARDPLLAILGRAADPDEALEGLVRLAGGLGEEQRSALLDALADDEGTAMRLVRVLGASPALGDHLARHPDQWVDLADSRLGSTRPAAWAVREAVLHAVGADAATDQPVASLPAREAVDALRVEYRRQLLRLAARDLAHHVGVDDVAAELSDLAGATLEAALAVARAGLGEEAAAVRLAVVALGKCGGHELNYVSDVDVLFVAEPAEGVEEARALRAATQLASHLMRVCSDHTAEGTIWPVDAALRPEGKAGPLVRTLASHRGYYERWAKTWEFQALLKARPVAGDLALGRAFVAMVDPLVWTVADTDGFVEDVQAMRRRVVDHIPTREAARQLKLGQGGLRDVEFAVQLLQLVHGRSDEAIRAPTTLSALTVLTRRGYVGREDGEAMHEAYTFLRTLEHRIQLRQLRRTHVVPDGAEALRRLGRSMGFHQEPADTLEKAWAHHRLEVRRLHEKLFYRPLLSAVARIPGDDARMSPEAAVRRMHALGFEDAPGAMRHLEALTSGVSRTAAIQRTLLPVMLEWFADAPDPDAGLFGFRRISESLGRTHWYLKMLRDEGRTAERLARLLASSRYATGLLEREPEGVRLLAGDLTPQSAESLLTEMSATAGRQESAEDAVRAIRAVRRRELFRISTGDLLGLVDVAVVGEALSRLTDAVLESTLEVTMRDVCAARGLDAPPTRMALVAMGRYGGFELSYASDADVVFVHDPVPGADPQQAASYAQAVANELRRLLALPATDPPLEVDADLRPEGRQGPLVRSLDSYTAYYATWSKVWEVQALLRADAVVGDRELRDRLTEVIDPLRFPEEGLSDADVAEVRRIKARVDRERLPRGADPNTHLKLGRGGLADVEWTVQLLQMQWAGRYAGLRTPRTLPALHAAREADLIGDADAAVLEHAWRTVSRARNAITIVRGKPGDHLPRDARERSAVSMVLGYPPGESDRMVNDYLRGTRRAHAVVGRVFWGE